MIMVRKLREVNSHHFPLKRGWEVEMLLQGTAINLCDPRAEFCAT